MKYVTLNVLLSFWPALFIVLSWIGLTPENRRKRDAELIGRVIGDVNVC